jgi:hypothetical protein
MAGRGPAIHVFGPDERNSISNSRRYSPPVNVIAKNFRYGHASSALPAVHALQARLSVVMEVYMRLLRTKWFMMGVAGCGIFVFGLIEVGQYYYMTRVLHLWAQGAYLLAIGAPAFLLGIVTIMTADAIKRIEDRLNRLEARQQGDK